MALEHNKITDTMLEGKGVRNLSRFPGLKDGAMQAKFDELVLEVVVPAVNDLIEAIMEEYATKQYVVDNATGDNGGEGGGGDVMRKSEYDSDEDGVVDSAAYALNGITECAHQKAGTVHEISRSGSAGLFIGFTATANCGVGDTFTLDGESVTINGGVETNTLDGLFSEGDWVEAIYDGGADLRIGAKIDAGGGSFAGDVSSITAPNESVAAFRNFVVVASDADIASLDVPVGTIVLQKKG